MPALSTLHNELRVRIPDKTYEFYNDALRWAINTICRRTSMWRVETTLVTEADKSVYDLDLPANTVIHSNLKIAQGSRIITRPVNGILPLNNAPSDYLQSFDTYGQDQILIYPTPVNGGETLVVYTAIKPTKTATVIQNEKLFDEYPDTIVNGALYRLFEAEKSYQDADRYEIKFKHGVSSIKTDVLKQNANTPFKISSGW